MVPVTVGFHTAALTSYNSSTSSKVKIASASGLDFTAFQVSDVQDVVGWPEIAWVETTSTQVEFYLMREPLKPDTTYEITFLVQTGTSGSTMSSVAVSLYTRSSATASWVEEEFSEENQGRGTFPRQGDHLINAIIKTAPGSLAGSSLAAAWTASADITAYLIELRMSTFTSGVVSIMPFPPSAWNFNALGSEIMDGAPCPDGYVAGVEGQAFGIRPPMDSEHCYVRKRGQYIDSIDLSWLQISQRDLQ
jgi:hypothetical protein